MHELCARSPEGPLLLLLACACKSTEVGRLGWDSSTCIERLITLDTATASGPHQLSHKVLLSQQSNRQVVHSPEPPDIIKTISQGQASNIKSACHFQPVHAFP